MPTKSGFVLLAEELAQKWAEKEKSRGLDKPVIEDDSNDTQENTHAKV